MLPDKPIFIGNINPSRLPEQLSIAGIPRGRELINILVIVQLHHPGLSMWGGCIRTTSGATPPVSPEPLPEPELPPEPPPKPPPPKPPPRSPPLETTAAGPAAATAAADTGTGTAVTKEQIIDDVPKSGRLICGRAAAAEAIGKNRGNARKHYCNRANN